MDTHPLLTIILPTFNAAAVLPACLESLVAKSDDWLEILLMDGGSKDDTLAIASSFTDRLPGLRMVSEPDEGIYDAMNKGMDLATGEWLYFLGADDRWTDADRIADLLLETGNAVDILQINARKGENETYTRSMSRGRMLAGEEFNHQTIFYRRSFVESQRFSRDFPLAADQLFNMELVVMRRARVTHMPEILVHYANTGLSSQQKDARWIVEKSAWISRMFPPEEVARREKWRPRERWVKRIIRILAGRKASKFAVHWIQDWLFVSQDPPTATLRQMDNDDGFKQ
jgi:glycosyltransferase involved in cell wall biosynthesis